MLRGAAALAALCAVCMSHAAIQDVRLVPATDDSRIYGAASVPGFEWSIDLARRGYVEEEYFVRGTADVYSHDTAGALAASRRDLPYVTQIVVRRPKDPARFSGYVHVEPMHPQLATTSTWPAAADYILRSGDVYVAMALGNDPPTRRLSKEGPPRASSLVVKWFDAKRYAELSWPDDDGIAWDVMGQIVQLLRGPSEQNPLHGFAVKRLFASGWSYTGSQMRTFVNDGFHERTRLADGRPAIDGYLVGISSRWNSMGLLPINSAAARPPMDDPNRALRRIDVPVVEFLTAFEVALGSGPQAEDRDAVAGGHRLYELGATSHSDSMLEGRGGPNARPMLFQLTERGYPVGIVRSEAVPKGCTLATSDVPISELAIAVLDNLKKWVETGSPPPRSRPLALSGEGSIRNDADGNPVGGIRIAEFEVPRYTYTMVKPDESSPCARRKGRPAYYRVPLAAQRMQALYGDARTYLRRYGARLDAMVKDRWLLQPEADALLERARREVKNAF